MTELTTGEYLLGLAGLALLRHPEAGGRTGVDARLGEIRTLLSRLSEPDLARPRAIPEVDAGVGYAGWAETYDDRDNLVIAVEEPVVRSLLDALPAGRALDAACGTGRHAAHLLASGHAVIGVDASEAMLERARAKLPDVEFRVGDLAALPVEDESVDVAVCALAISHLRTVGGAIAELARVVRAGGTVVVSNPHPLGTTLLSWQAWYPRPDGTRAFVREYAHAVDDYVVAARSAGLTAERCLEPALSADQARRIGRGTGFEDTRAAALAGFPAAIVWQFRKAAS